MSRRPEILSLALLVIACKRDAPSLPVEAGAPVDVHTEASAGPAFDGAYLAVDYDGSDLESVQAAATDVQMRMLAGRGPEPIIRAKSIGNTSVVFRLDFEGGGKSVFKPESRRGPDRWRGEVAAFDLAHVLGLDAVPRAWRFQASKKELVRATAGDEKATTLLAEEVVADGDRVVGAAIEWLPDFATLSLEKEPLLSQWRAWLKRGGVIPEDKKELARAVSTLVVFDYLTGNWDRWSGGNVATSNGKLRYVDNDGAFFNEPPKDALARNRRYLEGVDRFSKSLVERLRALTDDEITKALFILAKKPKAIEGVLARRKEALASIAKKDLFFE